MQYSSSIKINLLKVHSNVTVVNSYISNYFGTEIKKFLSSENIAFTFTRDHVVPCICFNFLIISQTEYLAQNILNNILNQISDIPHMPFKKENYNLEIHETESSNLHIVFKIKKIS
ncbi:hypothetical protein [Vallitalea okinawensis]|uniref:hypothetical protein n=1 Tax=Vallitalea okinawensis TaxID=2078660 RepID=UPI000CFAEF61|nr:hypothetical protein [Vallitalea okinawensis]